jgi:hypothetical protein
MLLSSCYLAFAALLRLLSTPPLSRALRLKPPKPAGHVRATPSGANHDHDLLGGLIHEYHPAAA